MEKAPDMISRALIRLRPTLDIMKDLMYSMICHCTQIFEGAFELITSLCDRTISLEAASCPPDTIVFGLAINGLTTSFKALESRIESASMVQM